MSVKRIADKYRKLNFIWRAIITTAIILAGAAILIALPVKLLIPEVANPESADFDIYDLHFSGRSLYGLPKDTDIVLIQIADTRQQIAEQLFLLNKLQAAVIGVDAIFSQNNEDSSGSDFLNEVVRNMNNLVLGCEINEDSGKPVIKHNYFNDSFLYKKEGFLNVAYSANSVVRTFSPFRNINDTPYSSFATKIVEQYNPQKFEALKKRNNEFETINYTGNLEHFNNYTAQELLRYNADEQFADKIKGKIVLLGFFINKGPLVLEDLRYTPLNKNLVSKGPPDTYGVVINANTIAMMLKQNYITIAPWYVSYIIAALLIFIFLRGDEFWEKKKRTWSGIKFILLQVLMFICKVILPLTIIWICLILFSYLSYKIIVLPVLMAIVVYSFKEIAHKLIHFKKNYLNRT